MFNIKVRLVVASEGGREESVMAEAQPRGFQGTGIKVM